MILPCASQSEALGNLAGALEVCRYFFGSSWRLAVIAESYGSSRALEALIGDHLFSSSTHVHAPQATHTTERTQLAAVTLKPYLKRSPQPNFSPWRHTGSTVPRPAFQLFGPFVPVYKSRLRGQSQTTETY